MAVSGPSSLYSTCYLELDSNLDHMLFVNYWDSVVGTMPLTDSGLLNPGTSSRVAAAQGASPRGRLTCF